MLPGKKYVPEDLVRIGWARKWLILIPAVLAGGATFLYWYFLPDQYRAATTILVVPQRVPENYVRPTVTSDVTERLQTISQQILSRTRLERIIEEFGLYRDQRKTMIMEDIIERMRRDVSLQVASPNRRNDDASSFSITYVAPQPRTAMLVTDRLAALFVQENMQEREVQADATSSFLEAQLQDAKRRLLDHEQKLEAFRKTNSGRLPSQAQSNLQLMANAQSRLQGNADSTNRDRERLNSVETQITEILNAKPAAPVAPAGTDAPAGTPLSMQVEIAKANLRGLELRYTDDYPDVRRMRRIVAELETKLAAEPPPPAPAAAGAEEPHPSLPAPLVTRLAALRLEAQEIRNRLETRKLEDAQLQKQMSAYVGRLELVPALESELTELMRDYATVEGSYTGLLKKSEESKIAANLERRQIGEQFKVIDGARLPERPFSPDRQRINLMGLGAGFGFGLALVVLLEYRDTTFKTDMDVINSLSLPVLAAIPAMATARERRRIQRRRLLLAAAASVVAFMTAAAFVGWKLKLVQEWLG